MRGKDLVRAITFPWVRRQVLNHIGTIEGLENIPDEGAFVLVPNHSSYFDHFIVEFLLHSVRGTPTWFLTKQESFEKLLIRVWTEAWYGIPVDRDRPTANTLRSIQSVLANGQVLCVYPEGTRGDGETLLPFKSGAFRFALHGAVPAIPVGMVGAHTVLAKGEKRFRNGRVHVAIGSPIFPREGESKRRQAEIMAAESRDAIELLIEKAKLNANRKNGDSLGFGGAALVDRLVTANLDDKSRLSRATAARLKYLLHLFLRSAPHNQDLQVQSLRLLGLRALDAPFLVKAFHSVRVGRGVRKVLAASPDHRDANYLLGRWHLAAPRVFGSSAASAVVHFKASAASSAPGDTRALSGLAEAEARSGNPNGAAAAYHRVIEETPAGHVRAPARLRKVREQLSALDKERG